MELGLELDYDFAGAQVRLERAPYEGSLYKFVQAFWPYIESQDYIDNWHIELICAHLQAVTQGKIKKLLINVPPGCSKSLLTSVFWPVWEWATNPKIRWFYASYDQRLSTRDSVRCRSLIKSRLYQRYWGKYYSITHDQNQKTYYETSCGGYRLATSIGGHGTGEHPDRIVIDDPHNVREAESEVERQSVIDWWDLTMSTRGVSRQASRVIIMQRLHEDDLAGHVLKSGDYEHICLCMRHEKGRMVPTSLGMTDRRTEEGTLLSPLQFPEDAVKELEKNLGAYGVAGQLQQRPRPKGGGMFKEAWFNQRVRSAPWNARRIRYWDRAATANGGCYTAGVLMAQDSSGNYYVEDVVHGQWEPDERNDIMKATALRDRARYPNATNEPVIYVEQEGGSSGKDAWKSVCRALAGFRVLEDRPTGSKDVRAEPWATQLSAGNVYLVDNGASSGTGRATWDINGYVKEHVHFMPAPGKRVGKYKDQVDASSGAFNLFAGTRRVQAPRVFSFSKSSNKQLQVVVATYSELESMIIDDRKCLLVSIHDPGTNPERPTHGIRNMLDWRGVVFGDFDPREHQDTWDDEVPGFGVPVKELLMKPEDGRDLWKWLLKVRDKAHEVIVVVGNDDRRPASLACGIADALRLPRKSCVHFAARDDMRVEELSLNHHVVDQTKLSRDRLVM